MIAPNAPHGPFYAPEKYVKLYEDNPDVPVVGFYGMITNIDDNMARLLQVLEDEGVAENTILVYTTDNGTAGGVWGDKGFTAGMRGTKGSQYDGGHRVPLLLRWPEGELNQATTIERLTAHLDILPTFIDLCNLVAPETAYDGQSLRPLLYDPQAEWPERHLVVESQRVVDPVKWRVCAVMTDRWRLVDGEQLFDMRADPGQTKAVQDDYPEVAERLRAEYEKFWNDVSLEHDLTSYMIIGSDEAPFVTLTSHDWLVESLPWNQPYVMVGAFAKRAHWAIEVEQAGVYEISLRRWPMELDLPINDANGFKGFDFTEARLRVGHIDTRMEIPADAHEVTFRVELEAGVTELAPVFIGSENESTPFYAYVTHKPFVGWQTAEGQGMPRFDPNYGRLPPQPLAQFTERYQKILKTGN